MANNHGHVSGSKLNIFYQNVRGIRTKCLELYNNILSSDYDIMCITETWLQSDISDSEFCDSRYDIFRCDRDLDSTNKVTGGGVMVCVLRDLCATVKQEWACDQIESICVSIPGRRLGTNVNLHIILIYLPPDNLIASRLQCVLSSFQRLLDLNPSDNYLLLGDFNMPCIRWSDDNYSLMHVGSTDMQNESLKFIDELIYLGFSQYNLIANSSDNILDLCFSNLGLEIENTVPLSKLDKCHPALLIHFLDLNLKPLKNTTQPHFNFYKCDYESIKQHLNSIDWDNVLEAQTVDDAVDAFYKVIHSCFNTFVPVSTSNTKYPVWYSPSLIKIIREKNKYHKKWKKYHNPRDYDTFSLLRARQHRVQAQCFKRFTDNTEEFIRFSPKIFWKYVKSKRGGSHYPSHFTLGEDSYNDGQHICTAFNKFFESVFVRPTGNLTHPLIGNTQQQSHSRDVLSLVEISDTDVLNILRSLDKTKGSGCDGVPPIFLVQCADSLAYPITLLFRRSLKDCIVPHVWKKAHIIPIHKKGSKAKIENYRPISILNSLAKVFEKLVYNCMYPIISMGISDMQHGFLKGRSTVSNLATFTDYVFSHMEGGGQVDVIYTDFEKAFDRVDHVILLNKLNALGIHGDLLRWVSSYLTNRSQSVVLGGYRSDYVSIPSGVPQGSHLGPLLYNAYIYDIYQCFKHANHLLYADDKKIYMSIKTAEDCVLLQTDLNNLFNYYLTNKITLSINKCQCISFTRKNHPFIYDYNFNGVVVERVEVVRDLGVLLDAKMTMTDHIDYIINRAYRNLGFIIRTCKPFRQPLSFKVVYYAYVRCILEYSSPIWSPCYFIHINRIERIQKKFLTHLNFKFKYVPRSSTYIQKCQSYKLLTLEERRHLLDMGLFFDILSGRLDCPDLLFGLSLSAPKRRTRHTSLFCPRTHKTKYGQNSVLTRLIRTYNSKFDCIDPFVGTKNTFKKKVKLHLLDARSTD